MFLLYDRRICIRSFDPSLTHFLGEFPGLGLALVLFRCGPRGGARVRMMQKYLCPGRGLNLGPCILMATNNTCAFIGYDISWRPTTHPILISWGSRHPRPQGLTSVHFAHMMQLTSLTFDCYLYANVHCTDAYSDGQWSNCQNGGGGSRFFVGGGVERRGGGRLFFDTGLKKRWGSNFVINYRRKRVMI